MSISAIIESAPAIDVLSEIEEESAILAAYQQSEKHGLEFGRRCYNYREKHSAQGSRTGKGLAQLLRKLGIKEGRAYYWISEYEIVIGIRQPKPEPVTPTPIEPVDGTSNDASDAETEPEPEQPAIASGGFWQDLYRRLNALVPSISDGAEHKTATLLQKMTTEPAVTRAEKNHRQYVARLLTRISKDFAEYAKALNAEVVQ